MTSTPSLRYAFRVWQRNVQVFLRLWRTEAGPILAEPVIVLLVMGLGMGLYVSIFESADKYAAFLAPGLIGAYALFAAAFECTYGSFIRMEVRRLYQAIIATPIAIEDVIAGEILWGATRSFISAFALLIVASLFGLIASPLAFLIPLVAVVAGITFASIGMVVTAFAKSFDSFNYFITLFITPMFFISGTFFPLDRLPSWVQTVAWAMPLTPVVYVLRSLASGQVTWFVLGAILATAATGVVFFSLAIVTMRRRLIR